jgi:hypothetical protein
MRTNGDVQVIPPLTIFGGKNLCNLKGLLALCESLTRVTGAVTAPANLEGEILIATGWKNISTQLLLKQPVTREHYCEDTHNSGSVCEHIAEKKKHEILEIFKSSSRQTSQKKRALFCP